MKIPMPFSRTADESHRTFPHNAHEEIPAKNLRVIQTPCQCSCGVGSDLTEGVCRGIILQW